MIQTDASRLDSKVVLPVVFHTWISTALRLAVILTLAYRAQVAMPNLPDKEHSI